MSVPHPGGDPNANLCAQLKRDVLDRVPQITAVEYVPDDTETKQLRAIFDPNRLDPSTGSDSPELPVKWYRQDPHDWFRVNYTDPNTGFHAGWHRDEDHPDLGRAISSTRSTMKRTDGGITFEHETPSLGNRRRLLENVRPTYPY